MVHGDRLDEDRHQGAASPNTTPCPYRAVTGVKYR
jgi:hypothetical protein